MYIVVLNHNGKNYITEYKDQQQILNIEKRCECCGDGDSVLGPYETKEEARDILKDSNEKGYY